MTCCNCTNAWRFSHLKTAKTSELVVFRSQMKRNAMCNTFSSTLLTKCILTSLRLVIHQYYYHITAKIQTHEHENNSQ